MKYKDIGEKLGFTEKQIRSKINSLGLGKERKINNTYFETIDTDTKAYFVGLLFADGYVVHNSQTRNYELGIELQSQDKYVLDKLNEELGGNNYMCYKPPREKIIKGIKTKSNGIYKLRVYSKKIVEDLIKCGVVPNKTSFDIPPNVPDDFFFSFLRGYIDGDGCYTKQNNNNYCYFNITCASQIILEYIQDKLHEYGIETHIYTELPRKHRLVCCNYDSMKIVINLMYKNCNVYLQRKYDKIKNLLIGSAS